MIIQFVSQYLYNEVGRGNVSREGAEVDSNSSLLMGCQLWIVFIIQRDARKGPSDGGRVTGVDLLENDWRKMRGEKGSQGNRESGESQGSWRKWKKKDKNE